MNAAAVRATVSRRVPVGDAVVETVQEPNRQSAGSAGGSLIERGFRFLDLASVAGPLLFLATTVTLEIIESDYDPVRHTISSLVWSEYGWAQTAVFVVFGISVTALALRLRTITARGVRSGLGQVTMVLIGVAFITIAIFPTSPPQDSSSGIVPLIHKQTVRAMAVLFPFACLTISKAARAEYRILRTYTVATAVIAIALLPAGAVATFTDAPWIGAVERVLLGNGLMWMECVGVQILLFQKQSFASCRTLSPSRKSTPGVWQRNGVSEYGVVPLERNPQKR